MSIHRLAEILSERGAKARLAEAWGKPQSIISELVRGVKRINEDQIREISEALNIPAWHLFVDPDDIFPPEHREILSAYMALEGDNKKIVDQFLFSEKKGVPLISEDNEYTPHDTKTILNTNFNFPEDLKS